MLEKFTFEVMMGSYQISDLIKEIKEGKLKLAEFQRTYKWHTGDSPHSFLESLETGIFVMPIIIGVINNQLYIIDGQQRLLTLFCFNAGYIPTEKEALWADVISDLSNLSKNIPNQTKYKKFPWKFNQEEIMKKSLGYSYIFNVNTPQGTDKVKESCFFIEMFNRINSQGISLENFELRRAYYYADYRLETLKNFSSSWKIYAANSYLDPIRYIPLIYKKMQLKQPYGLAQGYFDKGDLDKNLEQYYTDWILNILNITVPQKNIFPSLQIDDIAKTIDDMKKGLEYISTIITLTHKFSSKSEADLYFFGLFQLLYEGQKLLIDKSKLSSDITKVLNKVGKEETQKDIIERMNKSYAIYKTFITK